MNTLCKFLTLFVVVFGMNLAAIDDADARRFGGGSSFGKRSAPAGRTASAPRSPSQQAAFNKNQQARQQLQQRGGMMGLLGGLALGGLLGALFFGGAFEGLNFMDILLFGAIAFLLYKFLSARRRSQMQGPAAAGGAPFSPQQEFRGDAPAPGAARGSTPGTGLAAGGSPADLGDADFDDPHERPADFDEKAFVAGAVRAFELLQRSWNDEDLSEIRALTTDAMFGHIQDQYRDGSVGAFVQVLKVDATVLDVRQVGTTQEASVLFDAVLRESEDDRPTQVREIWHFTREAGARAPTWFLDGIEQMEG